MKNKEKGVWKYIVIAIITLGLLIGWALSARAQPFYRKTKHETVKKMTKRQVKKAQKGKTFYYRKHGKVVKRKSWK